MSGYKAKRPDAVSESETAQVGALHAWFQGLNLAQVADAVEADIASNRLPKLNLPQTDAWRYFGLPSLSGVNQALTRRATMTPLLLAGAR